MTDELKKPEEPNIFTHIHCLRRTKMQVELLSKVTNPGKRINMYDLVGGWADDAWEKAKAAGLVNDSMLPAPVKAHWVGIDVGSSDDKTVEAMVEDGAIVSAETKLVLRKKHVQMVGRGK